MRSGRIVLFVSGPGTGKTAAARAWVAKDPEHRVRIEDGRNSLVLAKVYCEEGLDVAYEALQEPTTDLGFERRVVQRITDPRRQRVKRIKR